MTAAEKVSVENTKTQASPIYEVNKTRVEIEETLPGHQYGRSNMELWLERTQENIYLQDEDFQHSMRLWLGEEYTDVHNDLATYGGRVSTELEPLAAENDFRFNNPRIDPYNGIGQRIDKVVHHPSYGMVGDIIYGSDIIRRLVKTGGLREGMGFYFLTCHGGEAGHTCPVICNFETARLLRGLDDFPGRDHYIKKLETPSYNDNYTASQFLTEVQGGSDVGANATRAWQDSDGNWFIRGEKWFCSNADAELMVITARYSEEQKGSKGLAAFLVPSHKPDGSRNDFTFRRLKEKMGTKALASAEIDYRDAYAIPLGDVDTGFNRMMEQVVHYSRIALAVAVLGFGNRGYQIARAYADTREAFGSKIIDYPLVQENLANIKADVTVSLAGTFALIAMQDDVELGKEEREDYKTFTRLMANIGKSVISRRAVDNLHYCIDGMGGNGAIETTSSLPRLFRDTVIHENWEGTHNTLYNQVLRDFARYQHDKAYLNVMAEKIEAMPENQSTYQQQAKQSLESLAQALNDMHSSAPALQTMKVQAVVALMADLFYFVTAVEEADHQLRIDGKDSKLAAVEWFCQQRLAKGSDEWNEDRLQLIARVVGA